MKTIIILFVILFVPGSLLFAGGRSDSQAQDTGSGAELEGPLDSQKLTAIIASGDSNTFLVDVRTEAEYKSGAIPSAINIPFDVISDNLPTQDRSARIIVYCRSGNRSGVAFDTLSELGFTNVLDFGGVGNWTGDLEIRE